MNCQNTKRAKLSCVPETSCFREEKNSKNCNCTYSSCSKKGICCECLHSHLKNRELPACCFPDDVEKNYDRSFEKFVECVNENKI